jgi:hypothetical protein
MIDSLFGIPMVVAAAVIAYVFWPRQRPLRNLADRTRRLANCLWMAAGYDVALCSRLWLVQRAAAIFRGLLEDLEAFTVNKSGRFRRAVNLLEEAERQLARAAAYRLHDEHVAALAAIMRARRALVDGQSLIP